MLVENIDSTLKNFLKIWNHVLEPLNFQSYRPAWSQLWLLAGSPVPKASATATKPNTSNMPPMSGLFSNMVWFFESRTEICRCEKVRMNGSKEAWWTLWNGTSRALVSYLCHLLTAASMSKDIRSWNHFIVSYPPLYCHSALQRWDDLQTVVKCCSLPGSNELNVFDGNTVVQA